MRKDSVLKEFRERLPFPFKDMGLLKEVFVHRSYLNEKEGKGLVSNERLEFLGDSVLGIVISHMLFRKFPEMDEGALTGLRARLVNRKTLAGLAERLYLGDYLFLGKGEMTTGGRENPTILAGAFEALIAAVYIERGFDDSFTFIEDLFSPIVNEHLARPGHFDYKPRLQELCQRHFKRAPSYRLVKEEGPPHRRVFEVEVMVTGEVLGKGTATKKKDAEQLAAGEALKRLEERLKAV